MAELTKLGKYEIRRELGKGAMGIVYEGFDPLIERTVAIKTILPAEHEASQAAEMLVRFKREAQAAGRLNHPNIVAIYEYGEDPGADGAHRVAYIAMEYIQGRELKEYFDANERFPLGEIARIMTEILAALAHAHAHGITHRDMKPANVIVLPDGRIKVADFGIARIETSELTQAGAALGTPAYMSPEQFQGQSIDGRSDIFSCGVILYQFLTGEKPFTGAVTTIMHKVLEEEPLAPSLLNATLSPAWDAVVRKVMAKKPAERYQTAAEFAAAIKTAAATLNADATIIDIAADATVVNQAAVKQDTPSNASVTARSKTRPYAFIAAGAVAAVVIGGGAYVLLGGRGARETLPTQSAPVAITTAPAVTAADPATTPSDPGTMVISALGLADPKNPRFNGDRTAAQEEARADAKRQLVEKALGLMVEGSSLDKNYSLIEKTLLAQSGAFIKTVIQEGAPEAGMDGLIATEARAAVKVRELQRSLNRLSREERIELIRNNGDPKVSVTMMIRNGETGQAVPADRSQLAENVLKERINSFGFRVWSTDGETKTGPQAVPADFHIQGEVKLKQLSMKLAASGLTISKTALTSWTIKAIDKATGEEIYLNTRLPKAQTWASEDQALVAIGKLVGEEFSRNFFLQYFKFGDQKISLNVAGLPGGQTVRYLLREFRGIRQVLDAQLVADSGKFALRLPEGSAADIIQQAVVRPLNAKFGRSCFATGGSAGREVTVNFDPACAEESIRAKLETMPPAGLLTAPPARGKALLGHAPVQTSI